MGKRLRAIAAMCLLTGSFFFGIGTAGFWDQKWGRKNDFPLRTHTETPYERDRRNTLLAENMKYVSVEKELVFESETQTGYAGISNGIESSMSCRLTVILDKTGEVLYQSQLIDPGYYLENIRLDGELQTGYYPCTALWSFYEGESDLQAGNTAEKIVVIVRE